MAKTKRGGTQLAEPEGMDAVTLETTTTNRQRADRDALGVYLDSAGAYPRLDADAERAALQRLVELRRDRWTAFLAPSVAELVLAWVAKQPDLDKKFDELNLDAARLEDVIETLAQGDRGLGDAVGRALDRERDDDPLGLNTLDMTTRELDDYRTACRVADERYLRERNRFLCRNLRLVVTLASRHSHPRIPLADCVQEGNLGLIEAVERFDVERGTRFSTYAAWWIRHYVNHSVVTRGREIRIPTHLHRIFIKARRIEPTLTHRLGRPPTVVELGEAIDVEADKVKDAYRAMEYRGIALDAPTGDEDSRPVAETLESPEEPDLDRVIDDQRDILLSRDAFDVLDPRSKDILFKRFGLNGCEPQTLRELGDDYELSRERIRQIQNKSLRKLRRAIEEKRRLAS